jgi:hypothetical protein
VLAVAAVAVAVAVVAAVSAVAAAVIVVVVLVIVLVVAATVQFRPAHTQSDGCSLQTADCPNQTTPAQSCITLLHSGIHATFLGNIKGIIRSVTACRRVAMFGHWTNEAVTNIRIAITGTHSQSEMLIWFKHLTEFQQQKCKNSLKKQNSTNIYFIKKNTASLIKNRQLVS